MRARETRSIAPCFFSLVLLPAMLGLLLAGCGDGGGNASDTGSVSASRALGTADPVALETYLKGALALEVPTTVISNPPPYAGTADPSARFLLTATAAADAAAETSTTNLQVAGVDEADHMKVGKGHLYLALPQTTYRGWDIRVGAIPIAGPTPIFSRPATGGVATPGAPVSLSIDPIPPPDPVDPEPARIRVLALDEDDATAEEVTLIELSELGTRIEALYFLEGDPQDLLVVIASGSPMGEVPADFREPSHWQNGRTSIHWIDVSDPVAPREIEKRSFMGRLANSRRIGDQLYVVSRHRPTLPFDPWPTTPAAAEENARILESAGLDDLLPIVQDDDEDPRRLVEPRDCAILEEDDRVRPSSALTTITQIDLRRRDRQRSACLAGTIETLYASTESLYLSSVEYGLSDGVSLHKFTLSPDGPEFRGSGHVAGRLWSRGSGASFQIGEREGVVGVLTSLHAGHPDFAGAANADYEHRLTLLREAVGTERALEEVSRLPNEREPAPIGKPDEFLHGVRFMGDRVYVVTFRNIDPLYILDVSDPKNPHIAGEVEVPGFSDYLHPVGTDLLIGVGQDTAAGVRNNWFQGVKIELFDVSDPTTLASVDAEIIGRRGSHSAALHDHHAFTFLADSAGEIDRFAVPIQNHATLPEGGDPDSPTQSFDWTDTGLHLFELVRGERPRLDAVGVIVAESSELGGLTVTSPSTSGDRAVIQGSTVHYVHGEQVWSARWDDSENAVGPQ